MQWPQLQAFARVTDTCHNAAEKSLVGKNSNEHEMQTSDRMCQYAKVRTQAIAAALGACQNHCHLLLVVWNNAAEKESAGRNSDEREMQTSGRMCQCAKVIVHVIAAASSTCQNHCHLPQTVLSDATVSSLVMRNSYEREMQTSGRMCQCTRVRIYAIAEPSSTCQSEHAEYEVIHVTGGLQQGVNSK